MTAPTRAWSLVVTVSVGGESRDHASAGGEGLWGLHSFGRYATQVGVERMLETFERLGVSATFFVSAWDAERNPDLLAAIAERGHEIAGHGYRHEDYSVLERSEQAELLERAELALESIAGRRPRGWRAPDGLMNRHTRPLLAERGYLYDSSFCDQIAPYVVQEPEGESPAIVELPTFEGCSDEHYYRLRRPAPAVQRAWEDELAAISAAGGLLDLALNPRNDHGSGRVSRLRVVERFLERALAEPEVSVSTCEALALRIRDGVRSGDGPA